MITGLTFERGNSGTLAGGATMYAGTLRNCVFRFNNGYAGGALLEGSARMYDCEFAYNQNGTLASAFMVKASALADRCKCYGNTSLIGTVYLYYGGTVRNSLIYNNVATDDGGGTYTLTAAGQPVGIVENCTIYGNRATRGGGMFLRTNALVRNTIAYNNTAANGANYFLYNTSAQGVDVRHTCTTPALPGSGNISGDPRLVNPSTGLFGLTSNSPCINAGTNLAWMTGALDLARRARIYDGMVDMGAYEYVAPSLWLSSNMLDFGSVLIGNAATASVTVVNTTPQSVTGGVQGISAPFSVSAGAPYIIPGGGTTLVTFVCAPQQQNTYTQTVMLSGGVGEQASLALRGTGVPEPVTWCWLVLALVRLRGWRR